MPLTLNVGLSRKVGLPNYGSLGASCNVQVELEHSLLQCDPETFHRHIRSAYAACAQAVKEELVRHQQPSDAAHSLAPATAEKAAAGNGANGQSAKGRPATPSQVRAIHFLAERHSVDVGPLLRDQFGVEDPAELTLRDASQFISALQSHSIHTETGD